MTYASQADLVDRFGAPMLVDLTDRAEVATGAIDAAVIARALADADAAIDGYLKGRYALPLPTTPPLLRDIAIAIAGYKLHRDAVSEKIRQDYVDAEKKLLLIAGGSIRLDIAGVEPESSGSTGVRFTDRERPLTADSLKGYI